MSFLGWLVHSALQSARAGPAHPLVAGGAAGAVAGKVRGFAAHGGVAGEEAAVLRVEAVREVVGGAPPHHVLGSRDGLRCAMSGVAPGSYEGAGVGGGEQGGGVPGRGGHTAARPPRSVGS